MLVLLPLIMPVLTAIQSIRLMSASFGWLFIFAGQVNSPFEQDASTAQTIVGTTTAGLIALTVFSFSMVMIVMNQAASHMSDRMLDNIIGNRVQKVVLGCYVGTIVFALFLSPTSARLKVQPSTPIFSIYLLLLFTIFRPFSFHLFLTLYHPVHSLRAVD